MPYVTTWERKAASKAARKAAMKKGREAIAKILKSRFGEAENAIITSINQIDDEENLDRLMDEALAAKSISDFAGAVQSA